MRIKIVIEGNKKGKIEIPVSINEIKDVYDAMYMARNGWKTIKFNKCDKNFLSFHRKLEHLVHDVLNEGKFYHKIKTKSGKEKYVLSKKREFLIKKPEWKR